MGFGKDSRRGAARRRGGKERSTPASPAGGPPEDPVPAAARGQGHGRHARRGVAHYGLRNLGQHARLG
jgi:hypothetical protein